MGNPPCGNRVATNLNADAMFFIYDPTDFQTFMKHGAADDTNELAYLCRWQLVLSA